MQNDSRNTLARIDWLTVILFLMMVGFGWLNIFSATYDDTAADSLFSFSSRYSRQFYFILAAFVLAILVMVIDGKFWGFFAYILFGLTLALLVLVLFIGREVNGAKSWLYFGPISLQPAELMKIGTALAISKLISRFNFQVHKPANIFVLAMLIGVPMVIILLQNDTGTALVFMAFVLVMFREGLSGVVLVFGGLAAVIFLFTLIIPLKVLLPAVTLLALLFTWLYGQSFRYFTWGLVVYLGANGLVLAIESSIKAKTGDLLLVFLPVVISFAVWLVLISWNRIRQLYLLVFAWAGIMMLIFSVDVVFHEVLGEHQQSRITQMLGIDHDPLGAGYNLNQSKIAIGSGGFLGKGFLNGTQTRFKFVPEQSTDFIFCTVGEEWGFIGSLVVIGLFTGLLIRLIILAERQRSKFSRVFGYGLISVLFFHYMINIGMTIGMMPVVGIPLPFFSYGGSSLWGFTVMLFIFIRLDTYRSEVVG